MKNLLVKPPMLRRDFNVELPLEESWRHLARVEQWPTWARHIKQVEVQPPGELGPGSTGRFHLTKALPIGSLRTALFTITEFNPYHNWKWVSHFLWLRIYYDHRFEELGSTKTKLTWVLEGNGFGISILGRLFAKIYSKSLDRAIPLLVQEMNSSRVQ